MGQTSVFLKFFIAVLLFSSLFPWFYGLQTARDDYRCLNCSVILIVVDTLRADHMGCYGYERETTPFIDAFARENILFEYAVAPAPWTPPSLASIFSGMYPTAHGTTAYSKKSLQE